MQREGNGDAKETQESKRRREKDKNANKLCEIVLSN